MKKQFLICVLVLSFVSISFCAAQTNGIKNKSNRNVNSLPEGVSEDWVKSLQDENGKNITPEDTTGDAFQTRNFNGFNTGDEFGLSVASAGDVNGDGYSDIIIGAPLFSNLYSYGGRAYIYFGGINVNTIPDVILSGNASNLYFGASVSSAGDVNGDGFSDVIVGATGFNNLGGVVMVYYGGSAMNNAADLTITGDNEYDQFGISLANAGDVNNDGYSDIIIGANGFNSSTGRASICLGAANMDPTPDVLLNGPSIVSNFGCSVAGAGDLNNDGFADVVVGASTHNGYTGSSYVFFGGTVMNNNSDITFNGQNANDNFGSSVASAGDINGDSYSDIIIGATGYNNSTGIVYLYMGGSNMDNTSDVTLNGENTFDYFGNSVSAAGDINGDGFSDIMVGSPNNSSKGKVYIYFGGVNMNSVSDKTLSGEIANSYYGNCVAYAGDMNGDGFLDIISGAWGENSNTGKVYLYMESMTGTYFPDLTMNGDAANSSFGTNVSLAGDVNGDGYSDIIIGSGLKSYIFFGGNNADSLVDLIITDGGTASSAGDVNGDGYSDIIVGDYTYNTYTGRVYVYYGGATMNNTADVIMTGEGTNGKFGSSVSTAGDVNGDGYSDVIVGASRYPYATLAGKTYIYYGGSSMNNIADVSMTGEGVANSGFGGSVSTAGDLNADGYSDVIIGANFQNTATGKAYIYYGGSPMNSNWDLNMSGESPYQNFGISVSTAGDVNGDGFSDVIAGTYVDFLVGGARRAYIFYGGSVMDNFTDVIMTTNGTSLNYGISVSEAGDLNKDGYSDVIVGAFGDISSSGSAHIYYGGLNMNNIVDVVLSGTSGAFFGMSVSSAGDVNGDGNSDIIVGSRNYNIGTGRSDIFYTSTPSVKPNLVSVKDIPNDQGGFVKLKWAKSGFDVPLNGTISSYLIERSVPPGTSGFQWEQIGNVMPTQNNLYYYFTSSTPTDSGINGNSTFYFRVTAFTNSGSVLYRSNIMSGNSIDNFAPAQVQLFSAAPGSGNVRLNWKRNTESDFYNYNIYRSISPIIDPETETVFATLTDSTYLDSSPLTGIYYYFIVAKDIHNNKSIVTSSGSQNITVNLNVFVEGFFNQSTNTMVTDTIKTYLRNASAPYAIVDSSKTFLNSIGTSTLKFGNAPTGNYYLVFKHRNSIETWSKAGGEAFARGGVNTYNFTDSVSKAYGSNMKLLGIKHCIFNGDTNQDGIIDGSDLSEIENDATNSLSGYVQSDVTGDDFVDAGDLSIVENNVALGVSAITP